MTTDDRTYISDIAEDGFEVRPDDHYNDLKIVLDRPTAKMLQEVLDLFPIGTFRSPTEGIMTTRLADSLWTALRDENKE